jgi:RNA polymerase sigma factor (sigma-70 family)
LVRHCYDGSQWKDVTVNEQAWQLEQFERYRPHLQAVAYRMLGSVSEADDALQEAWLRLSRADTDTVSNLGGWLTTVVGRVCLDMLRSRRSRQEDYVGSWLPEPIVSLDDETSPEQEAILADSVGLALLVVLDTLTPAERLSFVLHDMFGMPFEEIAPIVDRTPAAARQLASRARRRVLAPRRSRIPTLRSSARSSPPFSPRLGLVTSTPCLPCSTPTSSSGSTAVASSRARGHRSSAPKRLPVSCSSAPQRSRGSRGRGSSTAPPVWSSLPAQGQSRSWASPW